MLKGVRIVSTAINLPGPVAAHQLHQLGAEVVKVEPPSGDPLAAAAANYYGQLVAGQAVMTLDLKSSQGQRDWADLLKNTDLLLTSSRLHSLAKLGVEWSSLQAAHPRLCWVAIVGHPSPEDEQPGHDLTYQAESGLLLDPQKLPPTCWADLIGAEQAVRAALATLYGREKSGQGQYSEVALSRALDLFAGPWRAGLTRMGGVLGGALPEYNLYPTRQGWLAVAALEGHFKESIQKELAVEDWSYESLKNVFAGQTAREWEQWARARRLPLAAVKEVE